MNQRRWGTSAGAAALLLAWWVWTLTAFPASATAATPQAFRIVTRQAGLYHITYEDLQQAGADLAGLTPDAIAMTYLGQPVDILIIGGEDGRFDPGDAVLFYAAPYRGRYMTGNVTWLILGGGPGGRMATRARQPDGSETRVNVITRTLRLEYDRDYRSNYHRPRDEDHWFDMPLSVVASSPVVTRTYPFTLTHLAASGLVTIRALLHGGRNQPASPDQSLALTLNDHALGLFQWDGSEDYLTTVVTETNVLREGANALDLVAGLDQFPADAGVGSYWISPDWVEIDYPARAWAQNGRLLAQGIPSGPMEIVAEGFPSPDVWAFDITDPRHPVRVLSVRAQEGRVHLWDDAPVHARYIVSALDAFLSPVAIEKDRPSHLREPRGHVDYIAIVHRSLWDAIDPLLAHRRAEGMIVAKVDVQDIYDEFSFGRVDPEAIRDFLACAYEHWRGEQGPPRFVLLVGDGHYDFRGNSGTSLPNLIPPYLIDVDPWIGETAADNRYVSVDGPDNLPDMSIGRIPARTPAEVAAVVDKILTYEAAPAGDWQKRILFAADRATDFDADFPRISDAIRQHWLPQAYDDRQLYYLVDEPDAAAMRAAFKRAFDDPPLILQWFGHASRFRWGSVSMFNIFDPPTLTENSVWPVTFTYACWSGYFINLHRDWQSLGETLVLTPGRGSVADLSPAGLHVGDSLTALNQGIIKAIYQDKIERLGPAIDAGKRHFAAHSDAWHDIIDTSILFGDPALRLRRPDHWDLDRSSLAMNPTSPIAGQTLTATLTVRSDAATPLAGVQAVVTFDPALLSVEDAPGAEVEPGRLTWTLTLSPGESRPLPFSLRVAPGLAGEASVQVRAVIRSPGQDDVILHQTLHLRAAAWRVFLPFTLQTP